MIKKRLLQLLGDYKKYIYYNVIVQVIGLITQIVSVYFITRIFEDIIYGQVNNEKLLKTFAILLLCVLVRLISDRLVVRFSFLASQNVKKILREKIYSKLLRLGASYSEKISTSEVVQMTTDGVEQLETYFGRYIPQLFYSLLAPIILFSILSFVNFKSAIVLLICVPLIPISIVAVQKIAKKLLSKYWGIYTGLGDSFLENLQGLTTLKIYKADEDRAKKMDEEATLFRKVTMKVLVMQLNSISVMDIIAYGGASIGMLVAVLESWNGRLSFANALLIILLSADFFIPLRLLGSFFHVAMTGMAASDKIFGLLDIEEDNFVKSDIDKNNLDIVLENLYFSYNEEREILKDINIKIPSNTFTALVGESGSGKTTISKLLSGRNKNYRGSLKIGNLEIKEISEDSLMENITVITHNSYIFKGTVRDNLLLANANLSDNELKEALSKVNLLKFLEEQDGLDTMLTERGSNLSGGQCQRLAIARAILKDSSIYIFDEATSNIDVESENMIMNVIDDLKKSKTIVLISHRLSNVVKSDNIYFLKNGNVTESGSHDYLIELNGDYKKIYDRQIELENYGSGCL